MGPPADQIRQEQNAQPRGASGYDEAVGTLAVKHPLVARPLLAAITHRQSMLPLLIQPIRLDGLEELFDYLAALSSAYGRSKSLRRLTFLVDRLGAHMAVALEAGLSGMQSVAHEGMRAVMEIEFLLRDFRYTPTSIATWFSSTDKERRKLFAPVLLRQRHAKKENIEASLLSEATDYKAHSEAIHVGPQAPAFGLGVHADRLPFSSDIFFFEMFEHGRRALLQARALASQLAPRVQLPPEVAQLRKLVHEIPSSYPA